MGSFLFKFVHTSFAIASDNNMYFNSEKIHSEKQSAVNSTKMREISTDAGPMVSNGADIFITADYILWKTSTGNVNVLDRPFKFGAEFTIAGTSTAREGALPIHKQDLHTVGTQVLKLA